MDLTTRPLSGGTRSCGGFVIETAPTTRSSIYQDPGHDKGIASVFTSGRVPLSELPFSSSGAYSSSKSLYNTTVGERAMWLKPLSVTLLFVCIYTISGFAVSCGQRE